MNPPKFPSRVKTDMILGFTFKKGHRVVWEKKLKRQNFNIHVINYKLSKLVGVFGNFGVSVRI